MQDPLFPDDAAPDAQARRRPRVGARGAKVGAAEPDAAQRELAQRLPAGAHLGTSSWSYPGWTGLVWDADHGEAVLAKHGLAAYARHPLLRTVSLDRAFYQPLSAAQYAGYAAQVGAGFRFIVKAPRSVTDALLRDAAGHALQANPVFLDPGLALREFVEPALEGLGRRLGALVFQLSPLPPAALARLPEVLERLHSLLRALPHVAAAVPGAVLAVQVRDAALLHADFAALLRDTGTAFCLGLHARMPPIEEQLPLLRALWPGPLVCRWNLHRRHGAFGYEKARELYAPYDHIADADLQTRASLAKVISATCAAGHPAYVAIGNKAEGCAPLSVAALAQEIVARG